MSKNITVTSKSSTKKSVVATPAINPKAKAPAKAEAKKSGHALTLEAFKSAFTHTLSECKKVLPQVTPQESEDGYEFRIRSRSTRIAVFYYKGKDGSKSLLGIPRRLHHGYDEETGKHSALGRYGTVLNADMPNTHAVGYAPAGFKLEAYLKDLASNERLTAAE